MHQEITSLSDYCHALSETLRNLSDEKETVTDRSAYQSILIARELRVSEPGDVLLYCAALNALNAYVKQSKENKKTVGYFFKRYVDVIARYKTKNPDSPVELELQRDNGMTLMVVNLYGLQFSFHQVTLSDANRRYMAEDPDHPRLAWDGIRKQRCAETLFVKALENTFDRTNIMHKDGSDFTAFLDGMTAMFDAGTQTVADLCKKREKQEKNAPEQSAVAAETASYPLRNLPTFVLYKSTMKDFLEAVRTRRLVPFLSAAYRDGTGYELPRMFVTEAKYCLENLYCMLDKAKPDGSPIVAVCYVRGSQQNHLNLMIGTYDEGEKRRQLAIIELLPWNSIKAGGSKDTVIFSDDSEDDYGLEDVDPRNQLETFRNYISRGFRDNTGLRFLPAVYFYDAAPGSFPGLEEQTDSHIPVFCAFDEGLPEAIGPALRNGLSEERSNELMKLLKELPKQINDANGDRFYTAHLLREHLLREETFLLFIEGRMESGGTEDMVDRILRENPDYAVFVSKAPGEPIPEGTQLAVYADWIPEEADFSVCGCHAVIFDPYTKTEDEKEHLVTLEADTSDMDIPVYKYTLATAMGFTDVGAGNNWLVRHFGLGIPAAQHWDPAFYRIEVAEPGAQITEEEGIACVKVGGDITYDPETQLISAGEGSRMALYKELSRGQKGVTLFIEDEALRQYIRDEIEEEKERYRWLARFAGGRAAADGSTVVEAAKSVLEKSTVRNKYEVRMRRYLGDSAWEKLGDESQSGVLSALLSFTDMKEYDRTMDFSGVTLQVSKAFEMETVKRCLAGFKQYLLDLYGEDTSKWPKCMLDESKYGLKPVSDGRFTLGSLPFLTGVGKKNFSSVDDPEGFKMFCDYARGTVFDTEDDNEILSKMRALIDITEHVRTNYRNISAHSGGVDVVLAQDCMEYCITDRRMLGVLMDLFKA